MSLAVSLTVLLGGLAASDTSLWEGGGKILRWRMYKQLLKLASSNTGTLSFPAALSPFSLWSSQSLSLSLSPKRRAPFLLSVGLAIRASSVVRSSLLLLRFNQRRENPSCTQRTWRPQAAENRFHVRGSAGGRKKQFRAIQYCSSGIHVLFHAFYDSLAFPTRN